MNRATTTRTTAKKTSTKTVSKSTSSRAKANPHAEAPQPEGYVDQDDGEAERIRQFLEGDQ